MFEIFFIVIVSIYFLQSVYFSAGAVIKFRKLNDRELPTATVIVAARNEEKNIVACLESLDGLIYPSGKLEIIIVDDCSADGTADIVKEFIGGKDRFKLIKVDRVIGELKGKTNAIAVGIENSSGEIIITTDADCQVNPYWAKTLASYYVDNVGLVCGYTHQNDDNIFGGMQAVDFIYLLGVAAGTMNTDRPLSCIGNNMSYRRSVYDEIGGYQSLPFSVTEDSLLLLKIHDLGKYKTIYPLDSGGLINSKPCENLKELFHQKKRWGVGGLDNPPFGFFVMTTAFLTHLGVILSPFFIGELILYFLVLKVFTDYLLVFNLYKKLDLKFKFKNFAAFQVYFVAYVFLLPFAVFLNKKVEWKGRTFQ